MKISYTRHAMEKFSQEKFISKLKIDKKLIKRVIQKPSTKQEKGGKIKAIMPIDEKHSLVVVYRVERKKVVVITFFPAKRGRYEADILQRG